MNKELIAFKKSRKNSNETQGADPGYDTYGLSRAWVPFLYDCSNPCFVVSHGMVCLKGHIGRRACCKMC